MDYPLGNAIPYPDASGWCAIGFIAGVVLMGLYWYATDGRAYVRISELRANFPSLYFEVRRDGIYMADRRKNLRQHLRKVAGKWTSRETVYRTIEKMMEEE